MAADVKVPGVGESVQEGMIAAWHKSTGDWVNLDDVLLDLETDKATVEVVAESAGKLEVLVGAGQVVKVGDVIARIDQNASKPKDVPNSSQESASSKSSTAKQPTESSDQTAAPLSPAVRRILAETPIDTKNIEGSGRGGRLTKEDLVRASSAPTPSEKSPKDPAATGQQKPKVEAKKSPILSGAREETRKPMTMMRRRIAERLLSAQKDAAILTTFNEVDMTEVMALRNRYKDEFQESYGVKLGFMGFFLKASVFGLQNFPSVNAFIDGNDVLYHNYCDIGVAVSTEKGLLVPVIRDVDKMSLADIELAIADYAKKARDNKITIDDLSGGTFTVSNGGVFGSLLSTPILNPPQTAILGMHKTQMRPIVMEDGSIQARPMMYLAMSYDHRLIDGKEAVQFLVKVKNVIEDPSRLLLGV